MVCSGLYQAEGELPSGSIVSALLVDDLRAMPDEGNILSTSSGGA